jgi:hypothetical protein
MLRATANILPGPGAAPTARVAIMKTLKAGQSGSRESMSAVLECGGRTVGLSATDNSQVFFKSLPMIPKA